MVQWHERRQKKVQLHWWEPVLLVVMLAIIIITLLYTNEASASPSTEVVLRDILADRDSPLAAVAYTPAAYWRRHPDFDIGGWLAVVWAETSLARDAFAHRTNNVGCIRGGKLGRPWRDWRVGTTGGGFNVYPSLYMGQRAHILLVYARYNESLRAHDWHAFAARYWGDGYPVSYIRTLQKAHDLIVADAAERGLRW